MFLHLPFLALSLYDVHLNPSPSKSTTCATYLSGLDAQLHSKLCLRCGFCLISTFSWNLLIFVFSLFAMVAEQNWNHSKNSSLYASQSCCVRLLYLSDSDLLVFCSSCPNPGKILDYLLRRLKSPWAYLIETTFILFPLESSPRFHSLYVHLLVPKFHSFCF